MTGSGNRRIISEGGTVTWGVFFASTVAPVAILRPTMSLFVQPVTAELGWTHTAFFAGPSLALILGALTAPLVGAAADRWGVRPTLAVGIVVFALALASLSTLHGSLLIYAAISLVLFTSAQSQTAAVYGRAISSWYDARRGTMLAYACSGFGVGGVLSPLASEALINSIGWRGAYVVLGAAVAAIALPLALFVIRERPQTNDGGTARPVPTGLTLKSVLWTRPYLTLVGFFFCVSFAIGGLLANIVPMLTEAGIARSTAVGAVSVLALALALGRLLSGYLLDRYPSPKIALLWFVGGLIGILLLIDVRSPVIAFVAAALIGLCGGAEGEATTYFASRYFGLRGLSAITGSMFTAIGIAAALSQMMIARLYDYSGGYGVALAVSAGLMLVACALLASLGSYRFFGSDPTPRADG